MKLVWGDLHAHNFREFATIENGMNSRLKDCIDVISEIKDSVVKYKVDEIWFLGDCFHLKNNLSSDVIKAVMDAFNDLVEGRRIVAVSGNHDYTMWSSNPVLLSLFQAYIKAGEFVVVDKPMWIDNIYAEPYTRRTKELGERLEKLEVKQDAIFLGHQDIIGMQYGGFKVEQGLDADLLSKKFKRSFVGHYHTPEKVKENVISVGAPLQHNFGDVGVKKGWWLFDEGADEVTFIQNNISPRFYDVVYTDNKLQVKGGTEELDYDKDFFRVKLNAGTLPKEVEKMRWKRISYEVATKVKSRGDLKFSDSKESVIEKYVNLRGGDLDKKKLIEIGRRYV